MGLRMIALVNPFQESHGITLNVGYAFGGVFATATLILLLSFKEIISASKFFNRRSNDALNSAVTPLLIVFVAIVMLKTLEVLYP